MSLRDTLSGAKAEIARTSAKETSKTDAEGTSEPRGFHKRSLARAKPSRAAASSVRTISADDYRQGKSAKKPSEMTRLERREARRKERDAQDRRMSVSRAILESHEGYKRTQGKYRVLFFASIIAILLTWICLVFFPTYFPQYAKTFELLSIVFCVISYVFIVLTVIYDWRHVRPLRKAADSEVKRMSDKRVVQYLKTYADENIKRQAARSKNSRFVKIFKRHEQHK